MKLNNIINRYTVAYVSGTIIGGIGNITDTHWISAIPAVAFGSSTRGNILPGSQAYNMISETQQKEQDEQANKSIATVGFYALGVATAYLDKIIPLAAETWPTIQQGIEQLVR